MAAPMNMTWFLIPLTVAISLVYNATRYEHTETILRRAFKMCWMILAFMGGMILLLSMIS